MNTGLSNGPRVSKLSDKSSSSDTMSETTKTYIKNEKELAERLMKEKPDGIAGLKFVIDALTQARNDGLIRCGDRGHTGKFANLWIQNTA